MPFKSKAQERLMYSEHPDLAEKFQAETPNDASLPERIGSPQKKSVRPRRRRTSQHDFDRGMLHSSDANKI